MPLRRWRRRRAVEDGLVPPEPEPDRPELVEIEVGLDRFAAGALVARLEASEIPVRLLTMDEHGMAIGLHRRTAHRLLVRKDDEDRVRRIIELTS